MTKTTKTTKLTPAQYAALRRFVDTPYMRRSGRGSGWMLMNESDYGYDAIGTTINHKLVSTLEVMGFIAPMVGCSPKSWYFDEIMIITSAGIEAHDDEAFKHDGTPFAELKRQHTAALAQQDAARDARRIVVDDDIIFMTGKPNNVVVTIANNSRGAVVKVSTDLYADDIDDMIALLTAAKAELAWRSETAAQS